ncbi:MAG TPA: carboxymuconolactone decarboxylase family protein [Euryarchaeota archaeon]|nr:carboxymuconolactone decarboxylase family protein [Candidatus Woesearchaeota archaeon]HEC96276.1 carboxymuconolactone decarboxylase family protein [Euryarchaeota archaeon]
MENTKDLLGEIMNSLGEWSNNSPEQMEKFKAFLEAVEKPGKLDTKTKELISIALAVITHCKWCIAFHVKNALEAGATPEEIREAAWVAVLMGGGPALMYMQLVEKALKDLSE